VLFLPAQPAASVSTGAAIAVCFAPEDDCALSPSARSTTPNGRFLVSAYRRTVSSGDVGALTRAKTAASTSG